MLPVKPTFLLFVLYTSVVLLLLLLDIAGVRFMCCIAIRITVGFVDIVLLPLRVFSAVLFVFVVADI